MLTPWELDRLIAERDQVSKAAQPPTPGHSAAAAATEYADDVEANAAAQRRRSRIQHEADPWAGDDDDCEMDGAVAADLDKVYRDAYPVGVDRAGNVDMGERHPFVPPPNSVSPEAFRRGPITADRAAYSPGYGEERVGVHVPSAPDSAGLPGPVFDRPSSVPDHVESALPGGL